MLKQIKYKVPKDRITQIIWISTILIAFLFGWMISNGDSTPEMAEHAHDKGETATIWTCSMHPQIQQPQSGKCPLCGMDLIPASGQESDELSSREIALSERARRLANLQVTPVERKFVSAEIRMVGKIDYDETRLGYITARVPGRIDRMYVDYTGIMVRKGDHLVELYSPELLSTQQELIQTLKYAGESDSKIMQQNVNSIRERLRLWGLTAQQIKTIESSNEVTDNVTIYAPMGGIVVERNGLEGMYVETGTRIYTIADLSRVWLLMDAYESDVRWIRYGQEVEFQTETYPGDIFKGKIAFIDPILDEKTRTIKVRVNVDNKEGKLKPGMFTRAVVKSGIAAGGKVIDPELSGKWISPMHPEVVKNKPGSCDVCGMALVRAEELGYVSVDKMEREAAIVIPVSAPLITGKRAIVYIQVPDKEGVYEGREITLGPRAGDYYIVKDGLREGELVVVNGNFKIDSAVQIMAKPSMMNPQGRVTPTTHQHGSGTAASMQAPEQEDHEKPALNLSHEFLAQLDPLYNNYFRIQYALSHDQLAEAKLSAKRINKSLTSADHRQLSKEISDEWMTYSTVIEKAGLEIVQAKSLEESRLAFEKLSDIMITLAKRFGSSGKQPILLYHCPMAFDFKGADWLQNKEGTENPYFGSEMFTCGTQKEVIVSSRERQSGDHQHD
jgi:Cu(I)/Ag(I) efflux system membrane fusion protein